MQWFLSFWKYPYWINDILNWVAGSSIFTIDNLTRAFYIYWTFCIKHTVLFSFVMLNQCFLSLRGTLYVGVKLYRVVSWYWQKKKKKKPVGFSNVLTIVIEHSVLIMFEKQCRTWFIILCNIVVNQLFLCQFWSCIFFFFK